MINLFQGRENSYARQWVSDEGKYGYTPVNEPLNLNAVRNHLLGIQTLGIYQLDLMGKVKWIVFDLDVEKSHLDNLHDPAFRLWLEQGFQKIINEKEFKHYFGNVFALNKLKKNPQGFDANSPAAEYLKFKEFFVKHSYIFVNS